MLPAKISKIFLSATKRDCDPFRQALKVEIEARSRDAKIHLQEHWIHPAAKVVEVCRSKLHEQDAYIGLFGHRHGWQPPGVEESITQLEFRWAQDRWNGNHPPIFVLLPELGSRADICLRLAAGRALRSDFPDKAARRTSWHRQKAFLSEVRRWAGDRIIISYSDRSDLLSKGSHAIKDWNLELLERASSGRRRAAMRIPDADLGMIGREKQLETLKNVLKHTRRRHDAPALAFCLHGAEGHGQLAFAELVADRDYWDYWDTYDEIDTREPLPLDRPLDPTSLARWIASRNNTPLDGAATDPIAAVAGCVAARLRVTDLVFVLSAIGSAPDRWSCFVRDFWQPFTTALAAQQRCGVEHRLMLFVVDHEPIPAGNPDLFWRPDDGVLEIDPARAVVLPELCALSTNHVADWLDELASRRSCAWSESERWMLAQRVTADSGVPVSVYDRLQRAGFYKPQ